MGSGNTNEAVDSEKKDKSNRKSWRQEESHLEPTPRQHHTWQELRRKHGCRQAPKPLYSLRTLSSPKLRVALSPPPLSLKRAVPEAKSSCGSKGTQAGGAYSIWRPRGSCPHSVCSSICLQGV